AVLDSEPKQASQTVRAMAGAGVASAAIDWMREGLSLLPTLYFSTSYRAGIEWGLLNLGSGLLVGLNIGLSMLLGTVLIIYPIGPWIIGSGIGQEIVRSQIADQYWAQCQSLVAVANPAPDQAAFIAAHCASLQSLQAREYF